MDDYNGVKQAESEADWIAFVQSNREMIRELNLAPSNWKSEFLCEDAASKAYDRVRRKYALLNLSKEEQSEMFVKGKVTTMTYDNTPVTLQALRPPAAV
jgi:hypothetical protein